MTLNENTIAGKWLEIKGEVQKAWGKLTSDELEQTKGDAKAIGGLIQQKYGEAQEVYGKKLDSILSRFEAKKDAAVEKTKEGIKNV
jgi:uncharacterized protein YjbJ (UPF0337 family)